MRTKLQSGNQKGIDHWGGGRRRWEDSIETDLKEIGFGCEEDKVQWRAFANTTMKLRVS